MEQPQLPDCPSEHQAKPHYKLAPLEGKSGRVRFIDDVESIELERSPTAPSWASSSPLVPSLLDSSFVGRPQKYLEATPISRTPLTKSESLPNIVWKPENLEILKGISIPASIGAIIASIFIPMMFNIILVLLPLKHPDEGWLSNYVYSFIYVPLFALCISATTISWILYIIKQFYLRWILLGYPVLCAVGAVGFHAFISTQTTFPVPLGSTASTAIVIVLFFPLIYFAFGLEVRLREQSFILSFCKANATLLCIPLQLAAILIFIIFYKGVESELQALLGFIYPFVTLLFRWLGGRITKTLYENNDVRELPILLLGTLGLCFYPVFFLPYTLGWGEFFVQLLAEVIMIALFGLRFSGNDRKKLYVISVAQERFLEYRQKVVTEFMFFVLGATLSLLTFLICGSLIVSGYNKDYYYTDVTLGEWKQAVVFAAVALVVLLGASLIVAVLMYKSQIFEKQKLGNLFLAWMQTMNIATEHQDNLNKLQMTRKLCESESRE